jgi:hypothetical protein
MVIYAFASWLSKRLYRLDLEDRAYRDRMAIERQLYLDRVNAERIAAANQEAIARGVAAATQPAQPTPPPPPPA